MAPTLLTTTTLHHLNRAAELYSTLHPTLSAHLLSRAFDLQYSKAPVSSTPPPPPSTVCPYCAGPKLPGTTGTLQTRKHELTWSCGLCEKESSSPVSEPKQRRKVAKVTAGRGAVPEEVKTEEEGATGRGETKEGAKEETTKEVKLKDAGVKKKRAKQKGGKLAAMLAKQKETKPAGGAGGFGLDLADLMKLG